MFEFTYRNNYVKSTGILAERGASKMLFGPIVSFQFGCTESRKPHSFIALNLSSIPHFDLHHRHICGSQMLEEKSVFSSPNHFFIIRRANLIVATQNPKYCIFCFNLSLSLCSSLTRIQCICFYSFQFHSIQCACNHFMCTCLIFRSNI